MQKNKNKPEAKVTWEIHSSVKWALSVFYWLLFHSLITNKTRQFWSKINTYLYVQRHLKTLIFFLNLCFLKTSILTLRWSVSGSGPEARLWEALHSFLSVSKMISESLLCCDWSDGLVCDDWSVAYITCKKTNTHYYIWIFSFKCSVSKALHTMTWMVFILWIWNKVHHSTHNIKS